MTVLLNAWHKFVDILHYPIGWFAGLLLFMCEALSGGMLIIYVVTIASCVDLICGIAVSLKRKSFTRSELIRQTVEKLAVYGFVLLVFLCIDHLVEAGTAIELSLTAGVVGIVMSLAEAVSFSASLLILFPGNAFLRLMQKALTGEIARKLGVEEEEVAQILAEAREGRALPKEKKDK